MTLTRSQTRTQREAPGLLMLANATQHIEETLDDRIAAAKAIRRRMTDFTLDLAMPYECSSKDIIEDYIQALERVLESFDVTPPPPAPKVGYIQHYDRSRNKWVFCKVFPADKYGVPYSN